MSSFLSDSNPCPGSCNAPKGALFACLDYITSRGRIQSQLLFIIRCRAIQPFTEIAERHFSGNRDVSLCFKFTVHSLDQFISFTSTDTEYLSNLIDGYKFLTYVHFYYLSFRASYLPHLIVKKCAKIKCREIKFNIFLSGIEI